MTFVSSVAARHCLAMAICVFRHARKNFEVDEVDAEDWKEDEREGIPWRPKLANACKRPRYKGARRPAPDSSDVTMMLLKETWPNQSSPDFLF